MLHDPESANLFPTLTPEQVEELTPWGDVLSAADGETVFKQGESLTNFYVILEGALRVTRRVGMEDLPLALHGPGQFAGDIGLMSRAKASASGVAVGPTRVLRVSPPQFRRLMVESDVLGPVVLGALTARSSEVDAQMRQQEKMAALGKLSAGLAHELNNPAAAATRGASDLRAALKVFGSTALENDARFSPEQRVRLQELLVEMVQGRTKGCILGAVERSDREGAVVDWLETAGAPDAWDMTALLVDAGVTQERLESLAQSFDPTSLAAALGWLQSATRLYDLAINIEQSTQRITGLVKAMKEYSHVDQASLQEVDVNQSLETTLTIFGHRLKQGVHVERNYDVRVPRVCAYGGELNQVWTNIIDNAIDAMEGTGTLSVRTALEEGGILVEIGDSGPGIPAEVQPRIFEPFFTTKPVGKGTGLGLDISYRIVAGRHHGTLKVVSEPGNTRFQIRLPVVDVVKTPDGNSCPQPGKP